MPPDGPAILYLIMSKLSLAPTRQLHEQLIDRWRADPARFLAGCSEANRSLSGRGVAFEQTQSMAMALSALVLDRSDVGTLGYVTETLHELVERAVDWVLATGVSATGDRLQRDFADHRRMFPYLKKTRGLDTWQGFSRYDAAIMPDGRIKIIELNTGCPAGFLHAESFSSLTLEAIELLGLDLDYRLGGFGTIRPGVLIDELTAVEAASGVEPALVGLLNDENGLLNELSLIADAFGRQGREARIIHAGQIDYRDGRAYWRRQPVSLTLNKIRISTENSPGWNWKAGFEDRYAGFLAALDHGAMASVNNPAALTVAEDKGLLGVLLREEFQAELDPAHRDFIDEHILWTARLKDGPVRWRGETIDLLPYVLDHREQFVIKPANEGRGFRVLIGKYCPKGSDADDAWQRACRPDEDLPCVVQEYAELATLPVVDSRGEESSIVDMFLTVGLAVIRGRYHGLLSRVSANPVNNVGLKGIVQAVLLSEADR